MLSNLPKDLKILILSFVDIYSISNFCSSCKEFNQLFSNQKLVSDISFFLSFKRKLISSFPFLQLKVEDSF